MWFLIATGVRRSEFIGLRWGDLNMTSGELKIRRGIVNGVTGDPKSQTSRRDIHVSGRLLQVLREYRARAQRSQDGHPMWASRRGTPLNPANISSRVFGPAAKAAGLKSVGWHVFRHQCASAFLNAPDAKPSVIRQVQYWLGHSSPTVTMDIYWSILQKDLPDPGQFDYLDSTGRQVA